MASADLAGRAPPPLGLHAAPVERVVPDLGGVVEQRAVGRLDDLLEDACSPRSCPRQLVEVRHVGCVVLAVVVLERLRGDVRGERVLGVGERRAARRPWCSFRELVESEAMLPLPPRSPECCTGPERRVRRRRGRGCGTGRRRGRRRRAARRGVPRSTIAPVVDHEDQVGVGDGRQPVGDHDRRCGRRSALARACCTSGLVLGVEVAAWPRRGSRSPGPSAACGRWRGAASRRPTAGSRARRRSCRSRRAGAAIDVVDLRGAGRPPRARRRWRRAGRSAGCRRSMSWNRCGSWLTTPMASRSESLREVAHVVAVDAHRAVGHVVEPRDELAERGLAGARRADERDELAGLDRRRSTSRRTGALGVGRRARRCASSRARPATTSAAAG